MNPSLIECIFGDQIFKYQRLRASRKEVQVKSLDSSQAGNKEEVGGGSPHGTVSGYNEKRNTPTEILYFLATELYYLLCSQAQNIISSIQHNSR